MGKVRLACTPWINHSWHVALYVGPRGLTTSAIPAPRGGTFQVDFDLVDHGLRITTSEGREACVTLRPRSVADFHAVFFERLRELGIDVEIHGVPNELADPIPFAEDEVHGAYDAEYAGRFARVLSSSARAMLDYRGRFRGKSSPVHFFWGSFDLAVTRFSGRPAPEHPGGVPHLPDWVVREAYSHEVASAGFWPGSEAHPEPAYYAYAWPAPEGYAASAVRPGPAGWHEGLSEFVLPYEAVRTSKDPEATLDAFLESTYGAAADLAGWDRRALEWPDGRRPPPGAR